MANALGWVRRHPWIPVLLVALVVGQLVQGLSRPYIERSVASGEFPVVAASVLAVALVLALLVVVGRVQFGNQLLRGVRDGALSLRAPESLPSRYMIADPSRRAVASVLALIDVGLLLLLQSTVRAPLLSLADDYVDRTRANTVYVGVVVLLSLIVLVKLWRAGGPVLVLLLWWGLDRVVPTAGFLGARPNAAPASRGSLPAARRDTSDEPTERAPASGEATVVASDAERQNSERQDSERQDAVRQDAVRQDATIVAPLDATLLARDTRQDTTIVAPLPGHAPARVNEPSGTHLEGPTIVTRRDPEDEQQP